MQSQRLRNSLHFDVTLVTILFEDGRGEWTFIPFRDDDVIFAQVLDDDRLIAVGKLGALGLFDMKAEAPIKLSHIDMTFFEAELNQARTLLFAQRRGEAQIIDIDSLSVIEVLKDPERRYPADQTERFGELRPLDSYIEPRCGDVVEPDEADVLAEAILSTEFAIADLSEPSCIAGIDALTQEIDDRLPELLHNSWLLPVFVTPDRRLDEPTFFEHVRRHCPGAVSALRCLIETFLRQASTLPPRFDRASLHAKDTVIPSDLGTHALAYAMRALVLMDLGSLPLFRAYFSALEPGHETYTQGVTIRDFFMTHGWSDTTTIEFGLFLQFAELYRGEKPYLSLWSLGMGEGASRLYDPCDFADLIDSKASEGQFVDFVIWLDYRNDYDIALLAELTARRPQESKRMRDAVEARCEHLSTIEAARLQQAFA